MELSVGKLLIVLVIILVIFGAGKLPQVMNDLGKGIRSLKDGMKGDEAEKKTDEQKRITDSTKDRNV